MITSFSAPSARRHHRPRPGWKGISHFPFFFSLSRENLVTQFSEQNDFNTPKLFGRDGTRRGEAGGGWLKYCSQIIRSVTVLIGMPGERSRPALESGKFSGYFLTLIGLNEKGQMPARRGWGEGLSSPPNSYRTNKWKEMNDSHLHTHRLKGQVFSPFDHVWSCCGRTCCPRQPGEDLRRSPARLSLPANEQEKNKELKQDNPNNRKKKVHGNPGRTYWKTR